MENSTLQHKLISTLFHREFENVPFDFNKRIGVAKIVIVKWCILASSATIKMILHYLCHFNISIRVARRTITTETWIISILEERTKTPV